MIRLIKVIKKYRMHFNEHTNLYNNIINEFGNWYDEMDDNININIIKKNTINKRLKELAEKNEIKISEGYRKVVKKYLYKGSVLEERCFIRYICKLAEQTTIKNVIDVAQKRVILKNMC